MCLATVPTSHHRQRFEYCLVAHRASGTHRHPYSRQQAFFLCSSPLCTLPPSCSSLFSTKPAFASTPQASYSRLCVVSFPHLLLLWLIVIYLPFPMPVHPPSPAFHVWAVATSTWDLHHVSCTMQHTPRARDCKDAPPKLTKQEDGFATLCPL